MTTSDRIKQAVQLDELVARLGFEPNRGGYIACPAHTDKSPSLKIYGGDRGWYCFSCQTGGTVIDFYMHVLGVSASDAIKHLAELYGIDTDSKITRAEKLRLHRYRKRQSADDKKLDLEDQLYREMRRLQDTIRRDYDPTEPMPDELIDALQKINEAEYRWEEVRDG